MAGLLIGSGFARRFGDALRAVERTEDLALDWIVLPEDPQARVSADAVARIEIAFFSGDVFPDSSPAFFAAALGAPKLRWLHLFNAGVDHPIFARFVERGVTVTSSPGANATPIAQSAVAGLLALARRFPAFVAAQRDRVWLEHGDLVHPPDLSTQTLVVLGLGAIGSEIARLGRALGLHVVGVRRSRPPPHAPIDEWRPPAALREVWGEADWLAIACPLTDETRGLVDADAIAALPPGAHVINIARGEVIDEEALIAGLASGRLGGAYLDVFEVEPLPAASPLWSLPNVIVTPHASHVSAGAVERQAAVFLDNLSRFARGAPLANVVA